MPKTYNEIYIDSRKKLKEMNVPAYGLEARFIVANAAGKTMDAFLRDLRLYASKEVEEKAEEMISRRQDGEPVAYITGEWEFYGLPMAVTRDVLIPRTDTEVLVDTALEYLKNKKMDARVLDLCTGSGCVGCAIAKKLSGSRVTLIDNSMKALAVAKQNVWKNKLNPRVSCILADALLPPPMMLGSFDLLVCNPPYIPTEDIAGLDDSVRVFEPVYALDGGVDGMDFYRAILAKWKNAVRTGGMMMFEVGIGQAEDLALLMRASGLSNVGFVKDTLDIDRVVFGSV
ncbi:MAG: peptide chain release factor N(5)-glutamine methyltransferase [Clostridiales bacterium]|nr:peptide chain release factor N(5)-glutamine methyltransferase [Clostridiales bacterium]